MTGSPLRTPHDKLVRDRIPELIRRSGGRCGVETLPPDAYRRALLDKLLEEAAEARVAAEAAEARVAGAAVGGGADPDGLIAELADLQEVLDAVVAAFGLSSETAAAQAERRAERGGFGKRLHLRWTER